MRNCFYNCRDCFDNRDKEKGAGNNRESPIEHTESSVAVKKTCRGKFHWQPVIFAALALILTLAVVVPTVLCGNLKAQVTVNYVKPDAHGNTPPATETETVRDILSAGAPAGGLFAFLNLTADIPFAETLYGASESVSHQDGSPEFIILQNGEYRIVYQISADNPAVIDEIEYTVTVNLVSNLTGTLDSVVLTKSDQLPRRDIKRELKAGEKLYLQAAQAEPSEMLLKNYAIVFEKIA